MVSVRGLYTPVLVLTALMVTRVLMALRPHVTFDTLKPPAAVMRAAAIGALACAGPLSPVLFGLGERFVDERISAPPVFWRSSPRGVDLLQLFEINPAHPWVRAVYDAPAINPPAYVDYTAAFSLAALAVVGIAVWRAAYRPHRGWIWLTAGFAALSLGPFLYVGSVNTLVPLPWAFLRYVPIVGAARSPARFAVVAALGLAVLFCGALVALRQRYPQGARLVLALSSGLVLFELFPAPRVLYSAEMPSIYNIIAADPRPVRILELPFGVKDGVSSAGNFSSRYLYHQTRHGKRIMGGYLSRISKKRVDEVRAQPTLDALLTLSEGVALTPERAEMIRDRAPGFLRRSNLGYVVIDHGLAPSVLEEFVVDAFRLEEIARDRSRTLYRPTPGLQ